MGRVDIAHGTILKREIKEMSMHKRVKLSCMPSLALEMLATSFIHPEQEPKRFLFRETDQLKKKMSKC